MDHAQRVRGLERPAHVHRDVDRAIGKDAAAPGEDLGERSALHVLHHDEVHAVVRARIEHRDDVRMPDARRGLRLATEPHHEAVVVGELRRQDLHGHGPAEHRVGAEEDLGHAAAAELTLDPVSPPEGYRQIDLRNLPLDRAPFQAPSPASRTALAIGAATCPPVASLPRLPPSRTITATAI